MPWKEIDEDWLAKMRENFKQHPYKRINTILTLYDTVQGDKVETGNRLESALYIQEGFISPDDKKRVETILDEQKALVAALKNELLPELEQVPIYSDVLSKIPMLGDIACARSVNYVRIEKAGSISALRKYCGYSAGDDGKIIHMEKGKTREFNSTLKPVFYLWAKRNIMTKREPFCTMYHTWKEYYANREPELAPFIIDRRAIIKVVGLFIGALWLAWRGIEGLPVTAPYAQAKLGHAETHIITIDKWIPQIVVQTSKRKRKDVGTK